jgi:hypothetical protein
MPPTIFLTEIMAEPKNEKSARQRLSRAGCNRKQKRPRERSLDGYLVDWQNIFCLEAFLAFHHSEFDFLTIFQRTMTIATNGTEVYKHIFATGTLNKTETLGVIEPLDGALFTIGHAAKPQTL